MQIRKLIQSFGNFRTAMYYSDPIVQQYTLNYKHYWRWMIGINLGMTIAIPFWSEASKGILFMNSCFLIGELGYNIKNYLLPNDPLRQRIFISRETAKRTLFFELMMSGLTVSMLGANLIYPTYVLVFFWYLGHVAGNFTHNYALYSQLALLLAFIIAKCWDSLVQSEKKRDEKAQKIDFLDDDAAQ